MSNLGMMKKFLTHLLLYLCVTALTTGCVKTVTETKIEYVKPDIPESILAKCDDMPSPNFTTNGELLMAYITLQSLYETCSAKVNSIRMIILTNEEIYNDTVIINDK